MDDQSTGTFEAAVDEVHLVLGDTSELTLGSGGGSSEDKRYVYN